MSEIFVSPGVYVRERDFSYYVSSVNESSLAIIGETKKGPAFLPTKISNIAEFKEVFGNLDINKYAGYAAKSYFKYANQAYIVRVLGDDELRADWNVLAIQSTGGTVLATLLCSGSPSVSIMNSSSNTEEYFDADDIFFMSAEDAGSNLIYSGNVSLTDSNSPIYIETLFPRNNTVNETTMALQHVFGTEAASTTEDHKLQSGTSASIKIRTSRLTTDPLNVTTYSNAQSPMVVGDVSDTVSKGTSLFKFFTVSDGNEANSDVKVCIENIDTTNRTFDVAVRDFSDTNASQTLLEKFTKCTMDSTDDNYIARMIGDSQDNSGSFNRVSKYIYVEVEDGVSATALPWGYNEIVAPKTGATLTGRFPQFPMTTGFVTTTSVKRQYLGVNFEAIDSDLLMGGWSSAWKLDGTTNTYIKGFHMNSGATSDYYQVGPSGTTEYGKTYSRFIIPLLGGNDGWANDANSRNLLENTPSASELTQWSAAIDAVKSTEDYDINLLAVPGVSIANSIGTYAIEMVEDRADCFYVGDFPGGTGVTSATQAVAAIENASIDTNYAATYWPYVRIYDSDNNRDVTIPPTPQVLEAIAYTDQVAYPWFAPAGMNRGLLTDVIKTEYKVTQEERDDLYGAKINPIAALPGQGYAVWGNKTLQTRTTALDRINVRRMMIYIEKVIAGASRYLVFEQNDSATWDRFKNMVQPILDRVKIKQGLYDFRVIMDETTNTADMIDRGQMVGQIYVKPTKTAEAILINFNIMPTGAVFEE